MNKETLIARLKKLRIKERQSKKYDFDIKKNIIKTIYKLKLITNNFAESYKEKHYRFFN